jgi:hypothetical protein
MTLGSVVHAPKYRICEVYTDLIDDDTVRKFRLNKSGKLTSIYLGFDIFKLVREGADIVVANVRVLRYRGTECSGRGS